MKKEQLETLTAIAYTLKMNSNDKSEVYDFANMVDGRMKYYKVNREEHLNHIIDWAVQELINNFDLEETGKWKLEKK